jgi:hypothetical protein
MTTTTAAEAYDPWDKIAFYLRHALSLFGDPATLAQKLWLSVRDHKLFGAYMPPLEAAVRQLIFIAALDLAPAPPPPKPERKFTAPRGMPMKSGAHFEPDKPETWRASFKLAWAARTAGASPASSHQAHPMPARAPALRLDRVSAASSAERLEALLRAYENRDQRAAALARKLARDARAALAYVTRARKPPGKTPAYVTLDFQTDVAQAHQRFLHARDAPKTDSS